MGSVIDYIECPNCGHEAYSDFYYKTGEEYVNCQNCGYHYSATYKTDGNGEYITKDGTENYEFNNLIMETKELKNPYGAYRLKYYDSVAYQCGSLEDMNDFNQLKEQVMKLDNIEYFSINRFVDGEIVTIDIIDNGPKVDGAGFSEEDRVAE
jgi:DNA-directed RNA polymerase subunit RPC12/RpoP